MKPSMIFELPHKGIRNALSQLSLLAGNSNYSSLDDVKQLYRLGQDVFQLLRVHASLESKIILKDLSEVQPEAVIRDKDEHEILATVQEALEQELHHICDIVAAGNDATDVGRRFYLLFSDFHATYLEHMADEEMELQELVSSNFSNEELLIQRKQILTNMAPHTLALWCRFTLPAISHPERIDFMNGLKAAAPLSVLQHALETARQTLPAKSAEKLERALHLTEPADLLILEEPADLVELE